MQKCFLSNTSPDISVLSKPVNLIGFHGNRNGKSVKNYLKNHLLRSHKGDKVAKLFRILASTKPVLYCGCFCTFVAIATLSFR